MQQGRLAAARLADQGDDLARPQVERDAAQHFEAAVALHEGALDVAQRQRKRRITHDAVLRPVRRGAAPGRIGRRRQRQHDGDDDDRRHLDRPARAPAWTVMKSTSAEPPPGRTGDRTTAARRSTACWRRPAGRGRCRRPCRPARPRPPTGRRRARWCRGAAPMVRRMAMLPRLTRTSMVKLATTFIAATTHDQGEDDEHHHPLDLQGADEAGIEAEPVGDLEVVAAERLAQLRRPAAAPPPDRRSRGRSSSRPGRRIRDRPAASAAARRPARRRTRSGASGSSPAARSRYSAARSCRSRSAGA